jgi:GNAT superfamily N-acetyltransferase
MPSPTFAVIEAFRDDYLVSTDPARLDAAAVHAYLETSYWAAGIPRETVERALAHSLCFGLYQGERQVGLARVVTDAATFAYLCDVYVLEAHRGRGLARWLMQCVAAHPALASLRRFALVTRDAHALYEPFGFRPLVRPESWMEILRPDVYRPRRPED